MTGAGGADLVILTGYVGRTERVDCRYESGYEENVKYFCRIKGIPCEDQIRIKTHNEVVENGRFSLFDNTTVRIFTVTIAGLTLEDAGKYRCGVDIPLLPDRNTEVRLDVRKGRGLICYYGANKGL